MSAIQFDAFADFLRVGARASMTPRPQNKHCPRYGTVLRGWEEENFLIFDLPVLEQIPVSLGRDQECVIRMVANGAVCAFRSAVLHSYGSGVRPHVYLSWPREFDTMEIRQHQRLEVKVPCLIHSDAGDFAGHIQDLSCGGCRVQVEHKFEVNAHISLDFQLPDGSELDGVDCVIRNVQSAGEQQAIGLQFTDARARIGRELEFYITTTLARLRGLRDERPTVLMLSDRSDVDEILQALNAEGLNGVVTSDPADALYRMRLIQPSVLMVEHAGQEGVWNPVQFCAMAHHGTPGDAMKIVVAGDGAASDSGDTWISGFVAPNSPPQFLVQTVERFLASAQATSPAECA